jgi:hypothetical protein
MAQDFIQAEAQKHQTITNEAIYTLKQGLPNGAQDANNIQ